MKAKAKGKQKRTKTAGAKRAKNPPARGKGRPAALTPKPAALLHLEELLRERIHGKDAAVQRIAQAIRVRMTHLDFRPERPNGSFFLVGPPGVGKNEFAYALAKILYDDETLVVPIDMRAIGSEEDANRLTDTLVPGPQPILFEGMLTVPVRRRPNSILLLRGIEYAHPAAHRIVQQIVEQGWIEDARGQVSFENTIVFATSRIPEDENGPTSAIGFNSASKSVEERIREKLTRKLGEEFLDSFQEVIVVPPLSPDDVRRIARYKVEVVLQRLQKGRRGVQVSDQVFQAFIPDDQVEQNGAGMLNRTLESRLLNPLARYLLEHPAEQQIRVDVQNGSLVIQGSAAGVRRRTGISRRVS